MYAIAGVSGHTGTVVADTLLAAGKPVRVIVRDAAKGAPWQARGAEVAVASLDDAAALTRALTGVTGVYLLVPPRPASTAPLEENRGLIAALAAAVTAAGKPHVVLLSSIGAHLPAGTGPIRSAYDAEVALTATGAPLTAIRAAYFLENWAGGFGALGQGILPTFIPQAQVIPMVATRDIGRTAAAALIEGGRGRTVIELAGARDYSPRDVAAALAQLTGRPVAAHDAPLDAVVSTFTGFGLSAAFAELYREMYAGVIAGTVRWEGGAARPIRGALALEDALRPLLPA